MTRLPLRMTDPYSSLQGWFYETVIAPAVVSFGAELDRVFFDHLGPGARVLDVGTGAGKFAIGLAERRSDVHVTGLDLSPTQIERALRASAHVRDRTTFLVGSALDLPFADASFDGVLSCGSIKHWPDQARGVAECARVLKPGGVLAITEADRSCTFDDTRAFIRRWRIPPPLRLPAFVVFRTWVAGRSIALDEARALLDGAPLVDKVGERIAGSGLLLVAGRRA